MNNARSSLAVPQASTNGVSGDQLFVVNSIRYLAGNPVEGWAQEGILQKYNDFSLVTVVKPTADSNTSTDALSDKWISETLQRYEATDDVFQPAFLSNVFISPPLQQNTIISENIRGYLHSRGTTSIESLDQNDTVHSGPYVVLQHRLHPVWRLYDDTHGTYMTALRPQPGPFEELKLLGEDPSFRAVAVPSRIDKQRTEQKPLNGMRFAVKDIYHLKGIRTSFGSRSYYNVHGPESVTAYAVSSLQDLGAVLLGKLKLTQYGAWEEPAEAVDYQSPWNPRADGFQSPGGSSSGPACALAAYEWLDFTLGSDATGSILRPGLWAGLFALRPTWHAVSREGMGAAVDQLDMAGCYVRSIQGLRDLSFLWLNPNKLLASPKAFTSIIWPTDMWDPVDKDQQEVARVFVEDLKTHLGIQSKVVSFEKVWASNPPSDAKGTSLKDYISNQCGRLFFELVQNFKPFIENHEKKFGFSPYFSPAFIGDWEMLESLTEDQWKEAQKRMDVYRMWFRNAITGGDDDHSIFVLPIEYLAPRYRDEKPNFRRPPPDVNSLSLSPVMKSPEIVVPVGEIPYHSKITKQEEKLPFAVGVMGPPGTDLHLMDAIKDVFKKSGRPDSVFTGKWMYKRQEGPSWQGGSEVD